MDERYYDPSIKALVYYREEATPQFWDDHWQRYALGKAVKTKSRMVNAVTRKYLHPASRILEGGCGQGQNVYSLQQLGYEAWGVDFASSTVAQVKTVVPELNLLNADVRSLPFATGFFHGYWSIGVIEHFYEGYGEILSEIKRVLRPGGYLFLTYPCMSKFRKYKAKKGRYLIWNADPELQACFYQFAFSVDSVHSEFAKNGFELVESKPIGGLKGFKDEIGLKYIKQPLQILFDSGLLPLRALAWLIDQVLAPFAGHCQLMVFKSIR